MKVYLDSCTIQRPLDTFIVLRNKLEAEAVLGIIGYCDAGKLTLVSSEALDYEMDQNVRAVRKEHARAVFHASRHPERGLPVARARLIEEMSDAVAVIDAEGRVVDINAAGQRLAGLPSSAPWPLPISR